MAAPPIRLLILQHLLHEDAGNILTWASAKGHAATTLLVPHLVQPFPHLETFDVLVILGGTMGVYEADQHPWMEDEKAFISAAIHAGKTIIGICLGSQLLAAALGSTVYPHTHKEIGFFPVYKTNAARTITALNNTPAAWTVFHWHGDTFDLPSGAQQLFYSQACAQQGFRKGKCWGFQFHPEINGPLLKNMIQFEPEELNGSQFVQTASEIKTAYSEQYDTTHFHSILDNIIKEQLAHE